MITLEEAREIAYSWHGGGGSPLYSFASTSGHGTPENISPDTVEEVDGNIFYCEQEPTSEKEGADMQKELPRLRELRVFLIANMPAQPAKLDQ